MLFYVFLFFMSSSSEIFCSSNTIDDANNFRPIYPEEELRNWLVKECPYITRPNARPVLNVTSDKVPVGVRVFAKRFIDIDDITQKLVLSVMIQVEWPLLPCKWNIGKSTLSEQAKSVQYITVPKASLWQPQVIIANNYQAPDFLSNVYGGMTAVGELYNGTLGAWQQVMGHLPLSCEMHFKKFPFDKQTCYVDLYLKPWKMNAVETELSRQSMLLFAEAFQDSVFMSDSEIWTLVDGPMWPETVTKGELYRFKMTFQRSPRYYLISVFLPTGILTSLQIGTLFMSPKLVDRISFSMTVTLAFNVLQSVILDEIPKTSQRIYIMDYIGLNVALGGAITAYVLITSIWFDDERQVKIFNYRILRFRLVDAAFAVLFTVTDIGINVNFFVSAMST